MATAMIALEWDATCSIQSKLWDNDGGWHYTLRGSSWKVGNSDSKYPLQDTASLVVHIFSKQLAFFLIERCHLDANIPNLQAVTGHELLSARTGYTWIRRDDDQTEIFVVLGADNNEPIISLLDEATRLTHFAVNVRVRFDVQPDQEQSRTNSIWIEDYEFGRDVFASGPPVLSLIRTATAVGAAF